MNDQINQVKRWQSFFGRKGHVVSDTPICVDKETAQARVDFIQEELEEYLEANANGDIVGILDAILDILYFAFGMVVIHGLQGYAVKGFDIVHQSNMSKLWLGNIVKIRSDGKVLKPDTFERPEPKLKAMFSSQSEIVPLSPPGME